MPAEPPTRPPTEENCTTVPPPCARSCAITAFDTLYTPQKLVSNWARKSASSPVSMGATFASPALLTTTSSRPKRPVPAATAARAASASVTSTASGSTLSACRSAISASCSGLRAVATTRSPASRAARTRARPKPREEPVMNQTCCMELVKQCFVICATKLRYLRRVTSVGFQRGRSIEAKQLREEAILEAATRLGTKHSIRQVTLTGIASAVGMHKSALLRYFETREQIFLRLTAAGWHEWSAALRAQLARLTPDAPAATIAQAIADSMVDRPMFCDLLAQAPLNLERNVSIESVRTF